MRGIGELLSRFYHTMAFSRPQSRPLAARDERRPELLQGYRRRSREIRVSSFLFPRVDCSKCYLSCPPRSKQFSCSRALSSAISIASRGRLDGIRRQVRLDRETGHALVRVLPQLTRIRKAWRAHFVEHGCVSCHRKKTEHGAGGFCYGCLARITRRMRTCFRKIDAGRNIPDEFASITRRYDAAQRLFR